MKHVMPTLSQGLVECTKVRAEDPVDFLVSFQHHLASQPRTQGLISAPRHAPAPLRKYPGTGWSRVTNFLGDYKNFVGGRRS